MTSEEDRVLRRVRDLRRDTTRLADTTVTTSHGAGGRAQETLLEGLFLAVYGNDELNRQEDGAILETKGAARLVFTTDSFVVTPKSFPGGSLGRLAVVGTVNDVAVMGAEPRWISVSYVLEEGLGIDELRQVAEDVAAAARETGVEIVAGDTKVVERGRGDGVYVNTAGIGVLPDHVHLGADRVEPGDAVIVSGRLGDHGTAVMLARGDLALSAEVESDCASVVPLVQALMQAAPGTRWMRDPTRGGVASACCELASATGLSLSLRETEVPVGRQVRAACELLGLDPLYVANEGKVVAVVPADEVDDAVAALREIDAGREAAMIGTIAEEPEATVVMETASGGRRIVDRLVGDPLPRIC